MVIGADDPALKGREIAFNGIAVNIATHVFARAVVHLAVHAELLPDAAIFAAFVCHERGRAMHLLHDYRPQVLAADIGNVIRTGATATLDQRVDRLLARCTATVTIALVGMLVLFSATNPCSIGFHHLAEAT